MTENEELQKKIAKLKGWTHIREVNGQLLGMPPNHPGIWVAPEWPESIADAWELVEEMERAGNWTRLQTPFTPRDGYRFGCTPSGITGWNGMPDIYESGNTAPISICKAWIAWKEGRG